MDETLGQKGACILNFFHCQWNSFCLNLATFTLQQYAAARWEDNATTPNVRLHYASLPRRDGISERTESNTAIFAKNVPAPYLVQTVCRMSQKIAHRVAAQSSSRFLGKPNLGYFSI